MGWFRFVREEIRVGDVEFRKERTSHVRDPAGDGSAGEKPGLAAYIRCRASPDLRTDRSGYYPERLSFWKISGNLLLRPTEPSATKSSACLRVDVHVHAYTHARMLPQVAYWFEEVELVVSVPSDRSPTLRRVSVPSDADLVCMLMATPGSTLPVR